MKPARSATAGARLASPKRDVFEVQYLRGLAALMVVAFHLSYQLEMEGLLRSFGNLRCGVDVFFVISGFIMVLSTNAGANATPGLFFAKRLVRIAPLYWAGTLAMIAVLLVAPQLVKTSKLDWMHALQSLLFVAPPTRIGVYFPMLVPGWTLNLELLFYAAFAVGLALGGREWRLIAMTALPIVLLSVLGIALYTRRVETFYTNPVMLEFVYGMILAQVYRRGRLGIDRRLALAIVVLSLAAMVLGPGYTFGNRWLRIGVPAARLVGAALSLRLPLWQAAHRLGDASYSLYISHFFVLSALAQVWKRLGWFTPAGVVGFFVVGLIAAVIVALCCWRLVELPLTAQASRLLPARSGKRVARPAQAPT